jgi:hypothetical protein
MNGFQKEVRDRMLGVISHIEVLASDGGAVQELGATLQALRAHPQVVGAASFVAAQALLARGEDMKGAMVRGIDPALEGQVTDLADGQQQVFDRLVPGQFGVILGSELARALGVRAGDAMGAIVYAQQHLSAYRPPQPSTQPAAAKPADSEEGSALSSSCGFCPNTSCTGAASPSATAAFGSNVNCETLTVNTGTAAFGSNGTPSEATGEGAIPGGLARPAGYGEEVEALLCLLAFDHPSKSSARATQLLSLEHLEATADCLNSAVAEELGAAPTCAIERLLRQLVAVSDALREVNLGQGECMHLTPCSRPQHRADDVGALDDGSR